MQIPDFVEKYFRRQKLEKWFLKLKSNKLYDNIIVVPALDENSYLKNLIKSLSQNDPKYLYNTLIIIVVNNIDCEGQIIFNENQKTIQFLKYEVEKNTKINLGYIDASSKGKELPNKSGGVGYARKIGMDLSLKYFDYSNDRKKILICLDADCTVSNNYLHSIVDQFNNRSLNSAILNFEHILPKDKAQKAAIVNYEIFLRYYVLGLKYAKSPFAHNSVGSTIICDVESYVRVGGMNKRKAGEDFYFLEKLAKLNQINGIDNSKVYPSTRLSNRVPFGTGAGIKKFLDGKDSKYLIYSPETFEILKSWLEVFNDKVDTNNWIELTLKRSKNINHFLYDFLIDQNFKDDWNNILSNSNSEIQINRQKLNWMDGFRTLKIIHYLRDNCYPNQNMFISLNVLFDKLGISTDFKSEYQIPSLEIQIYYLKLLRKLTAADL